MRIVVLLPAPLTPRNPKISPASTSRSRSRTAVRRRYRLVSPRIAMAPPVDMIVLSFSSRLRRPRIDDGMLLPDILRAVRFYRHLYFQVWCAILAGILIGYLDPQRAARMKPLGDAFIKVIRMLIAPIIFCTVVHGIVGMKDLKRVGRVAIKALIYFEVVTTLALVVGLLLVNVWGPGAGMNVDPGTIDTTSIQSYTSQAGQQSVSEFVMHIIPATIVGAFAEGEILQVLFFSVLFAF